ncbi:MAG: hypothetical protein ACOYL1_02570 [Chlamydiia bacterium]
MPQILATMAAIIAGGLLVVGISGIALRLKVKSLLAGIYPAPWPIV